MKKIELMGVQEMDAAEMIQIDGGMVPKSLRGSDYNYVWATLMWPFYDIGYLIGRI